MTSRRLPLVLALLAIPAALVAALPACNKTPKEGDPCKEKGAIKCLDKKTGVVCAGGKWEKLTCEGSTGCMSVMGDGSCTHTNYAVGEPCLEEGKPECSGDHKAMMKCENAHWKLLDKCEGVLGCVSNVDGAKCDLGASTEGSPCTKENEGNGSCTPDGKALLICHDGKMRVEATCKGMHGCRQLGEKLDCNETVADLGDACDSHSYEGKFACTPDNKTRLVCKSKKFVKEKDCKCSVLIDAVNCE
jgi:hypothetical protein